MNNRTVIFSIALICLDDIYHNAIIICLKTDFVAHMESALEFG